MEEDCAKDDEVSTVTCTISSPVEGALSVTAGGVTSADALFTAEEVGVASLARAWVVAELVAAVKEVMPSMPGTILADVPGPELGVWA
jgi:hypothetical protein